MSPLIDEIDPSFVFNEPPELTREIASARWREINILFHSIVLLGDELEGRAPLLPVVRAAATLASCERALLFQWDDAQGIPRLTTAVGFSEGLPPSSRAGEAQAGACLLHRKPVLMPPGPPARRVAVTRPDTGQPDLLARLSVPITHQGRPWGALQLLRSRPFDREEAVLLWLFALVLEGVLPSTMGSKRHREMTAGPDSATGLLTPDHFRRRLAWEIQRSAWLARPLTVACVEVTEMLHGRPRGSSMPFTPREASAILQKSLRQMDSVTCMGGHHFIAAMPDTASGEARSVAGLVREGFLLRSAGTLPVFDIVMGFASFPHDGTTDADLMRAACAAGRRHQGPLSRNPLAS
ncbi:MAG TPA: GAF domain-containing protein [Patescibacteria group bacterium]|nr:GAF domain-containing protein [Patescibacteria group bacterium]